MEYWIDVDTKGKTQRKQLLDYCSLRHRENTRSRVLTKKVHVSKAPILDSAVFVDSEAGWVSLRAYTHTYL